MEKVTKRALAAVLGQIERQFGKGSLSRLGGGFEEILNGNSSASSDKAGDNEIMSNEEFRRVYEEKQEKRRSMSFIEQMEEHTKQYVDNREDFSNDITTSAWSLIYPKTGMNSINLIVGSDLNLIEKLLAEGVSTRDITLHKVDFSKGLIQFQSRFIRGTVSIDEDTNTYSDQKQPWLEGDGVYLFKNIVSVLTQTNLLVEFFRGLYALRKKEVDTSLFTDGAPLTNSISMCMICTQDQYQQIVDAHNKLRPDFQLVKEVMMAI